MNEITDSMVDEFYGECERPTNRRGRSVVRCCNCGEELYPGDEISRMSDYDREAGAILCADCAQSDAVLDSVWNGLSVMEKMELLDMQLEDLEGVYSDE